MRSSLRFSFAAIALIALVVLVGFFGPARADEPLLAVGAAAPEVVGTDAKGTTFKLSDQVKAGKNAIVYFYPKDDTPGCTKACAFRDAFDKFIAAGVTIFGVSRDPEPTARRSCRVHAAVPAGGRPVGRRAEAYRAVDYLGRQQARSFLVGTDGKIARVRTSTRASRQGVARRDRVAQALRLMSVAGDGSVSGGRWRLGRCSLACFLVGAGLALAVLLGSVPPAGTVGSGSPRVGGAVPCVHGIARADIDGAWVRAGDDRIISPAVGMLGRRCPGVPRLANARLRRRAVLTVVIGGAAAAARHRLRAANAFGGPLPANRLRTHGHDLPPQPIAMPSCDPARSRVRPRRPSHLRPLRPGVHHPVGACRCPRAGDGAGVALAWKVMSAAAAPGLRVARRAGLAPARRHGGTPRKRSSGWPGIR